MKSTLLSVILVSATLSLANGQPGQQSSENTLTNEFWEIGYDNSGIERLVYPDDPHQANFIGGGGGFGGGSSLGDLDVEYQYGDGDWLSVATGGRDVELNKEENRLTYVDFGEGRPIRMEQNFTMEGNTLEWDIQIWNRMPYPVTLGDVIVEDPSRGPGGGNPSYIFEQTFNDRQFISGDGSFKIYSKPGGDPPHMLLTVKPGTHLEYFEGGDVFIHSGLSGNEETRGTWRQPHTYKELQPYGEDGDRVSYGFKLQWAQNYDELRNLLYENGLIDVRVIPGMTVPADLEAKFSLHTKTNIDSIVTEFPDQTELTSLGEAEPDHHIYNVKFNRLGENKLTVYFDGNRKTYLEFFSTEPIKTMMEKRSEFITEKQQHRKPDKWYDGLLSVWDMKNSVLRGPDNTDGYDHWWGYVLAADDPALGIAPYLASWNALYPDADQIEAVEYYLENFVWGGLQRTDEADPYPYGVYGTPNWYTASDPLRRLGIETSNHDKMKVWRSYDYAHMVMLYYHMYQIADRYPDMVNYLDADGYLERLWGTAKAFFTYPYEILPYYETYQWGFYNELVIPDVIEILEEKGWQEEADWLRREWQKKVLYFVYEDPYPYRSEYAFDRTAFESTYALARYGATHDIPAGDSLWFNKDEEIWYSYDEEDITRKDAREFMDEQHYAGLAVRGWLEPKYFRLGADGSMSYMARMHGWSILNYGLEFAPDPQHDWLQLGYASYLSSFSLMNTGTSESNYGFWYPGKENDGALGWAFQTSKFGEEWYQKAEPRGAWRYDGEGNLGMGAVTRTAATILSNEPLFGWFAYGGILEQTDNGFEILPRDGVRVRFWLVEEGQRTGVELSRDSWTRDEPIVVSSDRSRMEFPVTNIYGDEHTSELTLWTGGDSQWEVSLDGESIEGRSLGNGQYQYELPISEDEYTLVLTRE
jgi:hypothetical protein